MCGSGQPASVRDALAMLEQALGYLATADAVALTSADQADSLRALERAGSRQTAQVPAQIGSGAAGAAATITLSDEAGRHRAVTDGRRRADPKSAR